jgi:pimeloyl-ACP methyl ester carboxylesterase
MRAFFIVLNVGLIFVLIAAAMLFFRGFHIDESIVFRPVDRPDRVALTIRDEASLGLVRHERRIIGDEMIAISLIGKDEGPLIVSCFGNASDRYEHGADYASKMMDFGQVLLWDYPGYGDSGGQASVAAMERTVKALLPLIEDRAGNRPLIFWGHSLGGFVCSNMAAQAPHLDALILETTAPSIRSVARAWTPDAIPLRVSFEEDLLRFDIPTVLKSVDVPILIIGAGRDRVLPVLLSRELADALPDATYLELPEASHYSASFDPRTQAAVAALIGGL